MLTDRRCWSRAEFLPFLLSHGPVHRGHGNRQVGAATSGFWAHAAGRGWRLNRTVSSGPRGTAGLRLCARPPGWEQRAALCGAAPWRGPRSPCPRAWPCTPLSCRMADVPQCLCIREKTKTRSTKPPRCVIGDFMKNVELVKAQQVGREDEHRHSGPVAAPAPPCRPREPQSLLARSPCVVCRRQGISSSARPPSLRLFWPERWQGFCKGLSHLCCSGPHPRRTRWRGASLNQETRLCGCLLPRSDCPPQPAAPAPFSSQAAVL